MLKLIAAAYVGYYLAKNGVPNIMTALQKPAAIPAQPATSTAMGWAAAMGYGQNALPPLDQPVQAEAMGWWDPGRLYVNYSPITY